jgi:glycosyltransferase involved in cell wall biosynthesis
MHSQSTGFSAPSSVDIPMQYFLVQPWFVSPGHPAQSLLRTYRSISPLVDVKSLVFLPKDINLDPYLLELIELCSADIILPDSSWEHKLFGTLAAGTFSSIRYLEQYRNEGKELKVFFLDANLYVLSMFLNIQTIKFDRLDVLCMVGPEFYQRTWPEYLSKWLLVKKLFDLPYFHLHLRTEDLAHDWKKLFPHIGSRIGYLPSLELQNSEFTNKTVVSGKINIVLERKFLIVGQIRPQKSVLKLFNLFYSYPSMGKLTIAGKIVENSLQSMLSSRTVENVTILDRFLTELEIKKLFLSANYNLMLYENWDQRMESAMLFESIKYGCPVVAYRGGWLGTKIVQEGLGWVISRNKTDFELFEGIQQLPSPCSNEYNQVLINLEKCHQKWSSEDLVKEFLNCLSWN